MSGYTRKTREGSAEMYCSRSGEIFDQLHSDSTFSFSTIDFSPWTGSESLYEKHTTKVISPPPIFSSEMYQELSDVAVRATSMISGLLNTVFDGNVEAILEWQGHPEYIRKFVTKATNDRGLFLGSYFSRPDILIGKNGPAIVEVNFGQSNGSHAFMDTIYRKFLQSSYCDTLTKSGVRFSEPQSMFKWGRAIKKLMRCPWRDSTPKHFFVAMATPDEVSGAKDYIQDFVREIGNLGYRVTLGLLSDLDATGSVAHYHGDPVQIVYCMCTYAEMLRADISERLILDLIRIDDERALDFFGSPANLVYDSKANLALIHDEKLDHIYTESDLNHARQCIPKTIFADQLDEDRPSSWVHKPINDFGGYGVSVVQGTNLPQAFERDGYIIQEIVENHCVWPEGESLYPSQEFCFGPSVIGGEVVAMNLRSQVSKGEVPIINSAQGAAVGAVIASIT